MSHHIPPHLLQQHPAYLHYPPPPPLIHHHSLPQNHGIAPQDTTHQPLHPLPSPTTRAAPQPPLPHHHLQTQPQPQKHVAPPLTNGTSHSGPLVATGDWTKDLVQLAKTAELKKHALTLQLHTAHILSAHANLEQRSKTIQDIREQKNKLDSERARLLNSLREINEDRDKVNADLLEASISKECEDLRRKIEQLAEGEYAAAKRDVDRLRLELGQPPLPTLQATLEEKRSQYLNERRWNGNDSMSIKRNGMDTSSEVNPTGKRPRGRPKGSKNRAKNVATSEAPPASSS